MKTFDFDWTTFIDHMPAWALLSMPCREFFLFQCETNRRMPLRDIGVDVTPLLDDGFLEHAANPAYVKIRRACLPFQRIMRIMARYSLFANGKAQPEDLQAYLDDAFSKSDQFALGDRYSSPVRRVSQVSWLDTFLRAGSFRVWEAMHKSAWRTTHTLFESEDCFRKTKEIVKALMQGPNPLTFSDLRGVLGEADLASYAAAIRAGIAYALLFPSVHKTDLLPVIGIWPGIHARLHRPKMQRPGAAKAEEEFHHAYLMDDMTALLVACAGKPLRLRQFEKELYADDAKKVEANLSSLPAWLKPLSPRGDTSRVETARKTLANMALTETVRREDREWLVPCKRGRQWLVYCQQERLRTVLDALRKTSEKETEQNYSISPCLHLMPLCQPRVYVASRPSNMMLFLKRAFGRLKTDTFLSVDEFVLYETRETNPWIEQRKSGAKLTASNHGPCFALPDILDEELEALWARNLRRFLAERLIPLGGVRVGRSTDGTLAIALTDTGRYLLALTEDFEYGEVEKAEIVVLPNFDIVFVTPSPAAEAALSRFAQRAGRRVGTVFTLTRASVFEAFRAGLTADTVLRAMAEISLKSMPDNVEKQIRDWFAQCRKVSVSSAVLVRCPDKETALKVRSLGGQKVKPLSATVLEIADESSRRALERKLNENGIAVAGSEVGLNRSPTAR